MEIIKRVVKIGNSEGVIIDKVIMNNLCLKKGDYVDISSISKIAEEPKEEIN